MSIEFFEILLNFSIACALFPVIILLFPSSSAFSKLKNVLLLIALLWFGTEISNIVIGYFGYSTILNFHIYDVTSTILYLIYFQKIFNSSRQQKILKLMIIFYLITAVGLIILYDAYFKSVLFNLLLTMFIPFTLSLLTFYKVAKEGNVINLFNEPTYWINSAILIHFGMSIVVFLIADVMYISMNLHLYIWPLVIISNILYNILFSIGAWKMRRTSY